eukprot:10111621-Alexandrium_andersonii.AAC.1
MTPNPPHETFWGGIRGRFWDRAVPGSNAWSNSALFNLLASRAPRAKDCGLADCGLEPSSWRFRDLGHPRGPLLWA